MANFKDAYNLLIDKEYSSRPDRFLHHNRTEETITLGGVYRKVHPNAIDWEFVDKIIAVCESHSIHDSLEDNQAQYQEDLERASTMLYYDKHIKTQVQNFFKEHFWNTLKLDLVHSNKIAKQIFLFGVVSGVRNSAKIAQRVAGVKDDGLIGNISLKSFNIQNEDTFVSTFYRLEQEYYDMLVEKNPSLAVYRDGWRNRGIFNV